MNDSAANKILLVEGDPDLRQSLASVLSCGSREVTSAGSAREFRDIQSVDRFTLAIVDLNLPDDSGFAIIRFLRQTSPTRIIVHTRRDTLTDRVEAYTQGADIYMVKPTPEAELLAAVEIPPQTRQFAGDFRRLGLATGSDRQSDCARRRTREFEQPAERIHQMSDALAGKGDCEE